MTSFKQSWRGTCGALLFVALGCGQEALDDELPDAALGDTDASAVSGPEAGLPTSSLPDSAVADSGSPETPVNDATVDATATTDDDGGPPVVPVTPCELAAPPSDSLQLWLKAGTGITVQDGRAARWADQSHHQDVVQDSPNNRPRLEPDALKGKPVLHFDQNDFMRRQLPVNGLTGLSIAIVSATPTLWKPGREWCQTNSGCVRLIGETGCSSSYQYVINWHGHGDNGGVSLSPKQEEIGYRIGVGGKNYTNDSCKLAFDPLIAWRRPTSIGKSYSSTLLVHDQQRNRMYVQGKLVQDTPKNDGRTTITNTYDNVDIGGSLEWQPRSPDGNQIAEVLIYNKAVTAAEREQLERYLQCQFFAEK